MSVAAPIRFDFGNGVFDVDTGASANVVIAEGTPVGIKTETIDGVTITLEGIGGAPNSTWGATSEGIGIITAGQTESAAARRRIDATRGTGEFVHFSFDVDATINSIRLGNFTMTSMATEEVEIAFVSGNDPFAGGSFTLSSMDEGPRDDIPIGVFVTAGTVLSLSASVPVNNGVLWNDIVVTPIPEPSTVAILGIGVAALLITFRPKGPKPV